MAGKQTIRAGAAAFMAIRKEIADATDAMLKKENDRLIDDVDWRCITERLNASLEANVFCADAKHRDGYLRALAVLLEMTANGCIPLSGWTPQQALASTRGGFEVPYPPPSGSSSMGATEQIIASAGRL